MICPLMEYGETECESCPYWPHCKTGVREAWNSRPDLWASFLALIEGDETS